MLTQMAFTILINRKSLSLQNIPVYYIQQIYIGGLSDSGTALWGFWYISEQKNDCGVHSSRGDNEVSPMGKNKQKKH